MKLLPFSILEDYEFCDELTFTYADRSPIENAASTANAPAVDSTFPATSSGKGDVYRNNKIGITDVATKLCHFQKIK